MPNATVRARVDENLKYDAEHIFKEIGLNTSQAINIFLKKVVATKGIPFDLKVPSIQLQTAMDEAKSNQGTMHNSMDEMMKDLKSDDYQNESTQKKLQKAKTYR